MEKNKAEWCQGSLEPHPPTKSFRKMKGQAGWEGMRTRPKGLLCSAGDRREGGWWPFPGSGMTCPSRDPEPGWSRRDQPGLCAWSSVTVGWHRSQPISCTVDGMGRGVRSTPVVTRMEGSSREQNPGQAEPQDRPWPGLRPGDLDCTWLAPGMGSGWAGGCDSCLSRALCFWQNEASDNIISVHLWGSKGQLEGSHHRPCVRLFLKPVFQHLSFPERRKGVLFAHQAVLWGCVFLQGVISLACKCWTFACLLAPRHLPDLGFFHTVSKPHCRFGTAKTWLGQRRWFL